jgi:hypothetical protein
MADDDTPHVDREFARLLMDEVCRNMAPLRVMLNTCPKADHLQRELAALVIALIDVNGACQRIAAAADETGVWVQ